MGASTLDTWSKRRWLITRPSSIADLSRVAIAAAMVVLAKAAGAQATPAQWTRPGDTVKVWSEVPTLRGAPAVVQRLSPDTIHFSVRAAYAPSLWLATPIAQGRITRIDVRGAPETSVARTALGTVGGLVIGGAVVGSLIYFTHDVNCAHRANPIDCETNEFGPELDRSIYTILGSAGGALIGAVVGARIGSRPVVMWRRVFP